MFEQLFNQINDVFEGASQVKKRFVDSGQLPEDIFQKFVEGDPTRERGKYLDWMAKTYVATPERPDHMVDMIRAFHSFVQRKKIEKTDIHQYKSVEELETALNAAEKKKSKSEIRKKIKDEGAKVVMETDRVKIIVPETYEASKLYGQNTKWCTAARETDREWKSYYRQGCKLYYIIDKKTKKKYAVLVYPSGQKHVYDELDNTIDFSVLEKELGL